MGKVGKVYGILGWINIFSFTEKKENIFNYLPWFFLKKEKWTKIYLQNWKKHKNNFIIQIQNISDRSVSSQFTNADIIISQTQLPSLKKNEYYWNDIINYEVWNVNTCYLGNVINLIRTNHYDVLVVNNFLNTSKKKILIPFIHETIIQKIDNKKKIIIIKMNLNYTL